MAAAVDASSLVADGALHRSADGRGRGGLVLGVDSVVRLLHDHAGRLDGHVGLVENGVDANRSGRPDDEGDHWHDQTACVGEMGCVLHGDLLMRPRYPDLRPLIVGRRAARPPGTRRVVELRQFVPRLKQPHCDVRHTNTHRWTRRVTRSTLAPMKALASSREGVGPGARAQGPLVGRRPEERRVVSGTGWGSRGTRRSDPPRRRARHRQDAPGRGGGRRGRRAGRLGALGRRLGRGRGTRLLALDPGDPRAPARPPAGGDRGGPRRRRALRGADRAGGRTAAAHAPPIPRPRSTPRRRASARSTPRPPSSAPRLHAGRS